MNPSRGNRGAARRWQVPATSNQDLDLPQGFKPLLLRLPAQEIELELRQPDILVGRHTLVDLCLPYPDISRKHCRIVFTDDCWHIVDVGSLNGIEVNGERKREADLHEGDTLAIAGLKFEVHTEGGAACAGGAAEPILRQIATTLGAARKAS
jgi:pSer/pThr/pTyr-binding forkhead associated (FHA) protein